jgi:phosphatidylglycerol:prolipoprotein diacylglycerol transferase
LPTNLPWAMEFRVGLPPTNAGSLREHFGVELPGLPDDAWVAVHPTQIYSSLASFLIFALALRLGKKLRRPGDLFLIVMALLSVERLLVEMVRAKDDRFFGQFTLAQLISVAILTILGAVALARRKQVEA